MNILLINGSPKRKGSASDIILEELTAYLQSHTVTRHPLHTGKPISWEEMQSIASQDILIFAFPLYVDGIPSHLLHHLTELEAFLKNSSSKVMVYAVTNCGFFEGRQNRHALEMMEIWCQKSHIRWGQGIGIGGGAMLPGIEKVAYGHGPRKNSSAALQALAKNAAERQSAENIFTDPNFPRFFYKMMAEMGWRSQIKHNGRPAKDLFLQK